MTKIRQSNIELLRILSMMAVIIVHLDGASVGLPTPRSLIGLSAADGWRIIVESITIVGVNCFTLISGYFGIRASISGFLKFTLLCMFYSVGIYSVGAILEPHIWSWDKWIESFMVYTHTDLWYVPAYMLLYLISPVLNASVSSISLKQFRLWLGFFVIANIWAGWLWDGKFNPTGYTPVQLVMVYLIGRYIYQAKDCLTHNRKKTKIFSLAIYVASTIITAFVAIWMEPQKAYAYNSPWVLVSSISIFIFFSAIKIQSATINNLAKGAFAAYLIHKNPMIWGGAIRPAAIHVWQTGSLSLYTAFCLLFSSAIYLGSNSLDFLRRLIFRKTETLLDNEIKIKA